MKLSRWRVKVSSSYGSCHRRGDAGVRAAAESGRRRLTRLEGVIHRGHDERRIMSRRASTVLRWILVSGGGQLRRAHEGRIGHFGSYGRAGGGFAGAAGAVCGGGGPYCHRGRGG